MKRTPTAVLAALALGAAALTGQATAATKSTSSVAAVTARPGPGQIKTDALSSGARAWFNGPQTGGGTGLGQAARVAFGTNVDAADPNEDLAAGQAETAIGAAGSTVVTAWNDATGFLVQPSTDSRASLTGVGLSTDRARTFRDLIGLRNNRPNQQWFGDPTVVAVDAHTFIIGSLYLPSINIDCSPGHEARFQLAVEVLTLSSTGAPSFGQPVVTADGGDRCSFSNPTPAPDAAFLDKEWLSYDPTTRALAMSYTRFFFGFGGQSGAGQVEMVRAHLPSNASALKASNWSDPITVWPEEPTTVNTGAYISVASNGDAYLSWERNVDSNLFNGNPFVFIHAARVRAGDVSPVVGGPAFPRVVTLGQRNSNGAGGVKSLDAVVIAGFNRGTGQDFPRIAVNGPMNKVIIVWNDASAHPLGDIWLGHCRSASRSPGRSARSTTTIPSPCISCPPSASAVTARSPPPGTTAGSTVQTPLAPTTSARCAAPPQPTQPTSGSPPEAPTGPTPPHSSSPTSATTPTTPPAEPPPTSPGLTAESAFRSRSSTRTKGAHAVAADLTTHRLSSAAQRASM